MLALSLSDKLCSFGIFVFVFNRFLFSRFSFVLVFTIFSFQFQFSLTNSLFSRFSPFSFSFSLTKITLCLRIYQPGWFPVAFPVVQYSEYPSPTMVVFLFYRHGIRTPYQTNILKELTDCRSRIVVGSDIPVLKIISVLVIIKYGDIHYSISFVNHFCTSFSKFLQQSFLYLRV